MASSYPVFCCPQCKGPLKFGWEEYSCPQCVKRYPIVLGFPDFRVFTNPHIDYEYDYKIAEFLVEQSDKLDFEGLAKLDSKTTPLSISKDRTDRFMRRMFALVEKGVENLTEIEEISEKYYRNVIGSNAVLEIGCGTGGFLVATKDKFKHAMGIDIALRFLVFSKKRINELGLKARLICGCAEYLPFEDGSFDLVVAEDVLEHVRDQEATLRECHRVINKKGILFLATPNRFSIAPEPHVGVWGVGFLPRKWMNKYVKLIKGIPYEHYKVLSFFELKMLLRKCSFQNHKILLPSILKAELKGFSTFEKIQVAIYDLVRKIPFIRASLYIIGPFFHIICRPNKDGSKKDSL
jgi:ubiquinone/menaquinone biosynthesis C-methylase UbiE